MRSKIRHLSTLGRHTFRSAPMQQARPSRESILDQLERMLASETFAGAERSRALLSFLVRHVADNQSDRLKEYTIGSEALGRGDSFDPRTDPIVRAEASRLRTRLERYYATTGSADGILITLPRGSYVPQLQERLVQRDVELAGRAAEPASPPGKLRELIWFVLGGVLVGAAAMFLVSFRSPRVPAAAFGGDIELGGADYSPGADFGNDVILSPDGTRLVFVALGSDHVTRLMTLPLEPGRRTAVRLPGTDGARAPFFSPDSRTVGFWADARLKMVSVDGGSPIELAAAEDFGGASWGANGEIIASIDGTLRRITLTSQSTVVADLRQDGIRPWWPDLLPGGTHVLFTAVSRNGPDASNVEVLSLADGQRKPLVRAGFGRYVDGALLYVNQGTLYAVPFDLPRLAVQGTGVPMLEELVAHSTIFGNAKLDLDRNGTLIYRRSPALVAAWLRRGGGIDPLTMTPGPYTFPRVSPDGERLAINVSDGGVLRTEIHDLRSGAAPTRLPFTPGRMSTVWHPDGFLVLGSLTGMSWMTADDPSKLAALTESSNVQIPWSFTADGTRLAYAETSPSLDLWTVPIGHHEGTLTAGTPELFLRTPYFEGAPSFSPDGRWMAYGWGPGSKWNVYVRPFPPDGSKEIQISPNGGRIPRWLPNGREIVYRTDEHRLMVVEYQVKNGGLTVGEPAPWTPDRLADTGVIANFDLYGDRVLGLVPAARDEAERMRTQVTVVPRFLDEVKRRLAQTTK
jgi:Tol biopolymer transport system component